MSNNGGNGVQQTSAEVQEQKTNTDLWNYSQKVYKPFLDKFISRQTENAASGQEAGAVKGQINAEVMKGVSAAARPDTVNPVAMTKQMNNAADINATGQNTAAAKVKQRQMGSLQNIVDIGRGQTTQVQQIQGQLAGESVQNAIREKQAQLNTQGVMQNSIGSVIGAGAAAGMRYMNNRPPDLGEWGQLDFRNNIPGSGMVDNYGDPIGS